MKSQLFLVPRHDLSVLNVHNYTSYSHDLYQPIVMEANSSQLVIINTRWQLDT